MSHSTKSRNALSIEPAVCRECGSDLDLHQPDTDLPERLLGTCGACKAWYLIDAIGGHQTVIPETRGTLSTAKSA